MFKRLTLLAFLFFLSGAAFALAPVDNLAAVTYDGITFRYSPETFGALLPAWDAGTEFQTDAHYFANVAAHTSFKFFRPDPAYPEVNLTGELRVYRIAEL